MDAVGADQDIAAYGMDMTASAVEKMGGDAAFILGESAKPAAGVDRLLAEPLLHRAVDHALQSAAVD